MSRMNAKDFFLSWGMLLIGVVMNVAGTTVIKLKMNALGKLNLDSVAGFFGYFLSLAREPLSLMGIILVLVAPLPLAVALSRMEVSVALPVATALNFLVLIPLSVLLLNETFTASKLLAIGLIVASVYLLYK
jgi:multidrug transporter EmrE-like cation transporter